ncbi:MAG: Glu/Leu/Phe/Val dehydrogenase [Phyllobacteriaceae bacterium]|nr:Glu/Leu/Phe/Val dehydrogenase [Phyllobacteriaceae bacterium]
MSDETLLDRALIRLEEAANHLQIDPDVTEKLKYPRETTKTRLLIRMDDGSRKSFLAWRCRYDDTRGPTKGGIRFHPDSTIEEVETLAFWMTFKCAVMNLPYGGGKGAIRVDPRQLSKSELERLSRAYVQAFANTIGPDRDIPAPDVYTNAMIMGWMSDEYNQITGQVTPAVITGKPIALGGSLGRNDATARGGFYLVRHLANELGLDKDHTVAIQGFGNAGQYYARLTAADGNSVVAVSDSAGAIYRPGGLDVEKLIAGKNAGRRVADMAAELGATVIAADDLLSVEADLLVPAALEDMITKENAGSIKAKVVLELANGPITPDADKILNEKGTIVLPDILANAGGVTVSYFEWVQNRQGFYWDVEEIHARLKKAMEREGAAVWQIVKDRNVSGRSAAYIHALGRLATAIEAHGTQPFFAG